VTSSAGEHMDNFELAARTWAAQLDLLEKGRLIVEHYDLDPALLEDMHQAYAEQDFDGFLEALVVLWRRWLIAEGKA
jgi:hypothetical protein